MVFDPTNLPRVKLDEAEIKGWVEVETLGPVPYDDNLVTKSNLDLAQAAILEAIRNKHFFEEEGILRPLWNLPEQYRRVYNWIQTLQNLNRQTIMKHMQGKI